MNTSSFVKTEEILFTAAGMAGDRTYDIIPRGFYVSLISDAFREFNIDSFFSIERHDVKIPTDTLTIPLPLNCFNVKEVYVYSGDACSVSNSKKLWWKRNYYTKGKGFFANDKGNFILTKRGIKPSDKYTNGVVHCIFSVFVK